MQFGKEMFVRLWGTWDVKAYFSILQYLTYICKTIQMSGYFWKYFC